MHAVLLRDVKFCLLGHCYDSMIHTHTHNRFKALSVISYACGTNMLKRNVKD